jgi:hypothetical protein
MDDTQLSELYSDSYNVIANDSILTVKESL